MKKHAIVAMIWPTLACNCGVVIRLERPETWGTMRGKDRLLDAHADHAREMEKEGF